jgi:hypothetical protein
MMEPNSHISWRHSVCFADGTISGKANREFEAGVAGWLAVKWSKFCNPGESPASVPVQFKPTN